MVYVVVKSYANRYLRPFFGSSNPIDPPLFVVMRTVIFAAVFPILLWVLQLRYTTRLLPVDVGLLIDAVLVAVLDQLPPVSALLVHAHVRKRVGLLLYPVVC